MLSICLQTFRLLPIRCGQVDLFYVYTKFQTNIFSSFFCNHSRSDNTTALISTGSWTEEISTFPEKSINIAEKNGLNVIISLPRRKFLNNAFLFRAANYTGSIITRNLECDENKFLKQFSPQKKGSKKILDTFRYFLSIRVKIFPLHFPSSSPVLEFPPKCVGNTIRGCH